jgi:hypothetical protein
MKPKILGPLAVGLFSLAAGTASAVSVQTNALTIDSIKTRGEAGVGGPVPEPGSLALMGLGLTGLGLGRPRRA